MTVPSDERLRELAQRMEQTGISYMDTTSRHETAAACRAVIAARALCDAPPTPVREGYSQRIVDMTDAIPRAKLRAILGPTGGGDDRRTVGALSQPD